MNDQTIKADNGKPRVSLVPTEGIIEVAKVREYGVNKYGTSESWKQVAIERYIDALGRHYLAFKDDPYGVDEESGLLHISHIACNAMFLCHLVKHRKDKDDRNRSNSQVQETDKQPTESKPNTILRSWLRRVFVPSQRRCRTILIVGGNPE